jgi:hypothetical protein
MPHVRKLTSDLMLSPRANLQRDLAQGSTAMHETLQQLDRCPDGRRLQNACDSPKKNCKMYPPAI